MAKTKKDPNPVKLVYGTLMIPVAETHTLCFIVEEHALYLKRLGEALHGSKTWGAFLFKLPSEELEIISDSIIDRNGKMPPADKPFDRCEIGPYCDGDWPKWPLQSMLSWMPSQIINKYGEKKETVLNGDYLTIKPEFEAAVISALEQYGYSVEKNNELVLRAQATDPDYFRNPDLAAE